MRRILGFATIALLVAATLGGGPVAATDHDTFPATITDEDVKATVAAYDARGERIEVVGVANENEVVLTTYTVPMALNDSDRGILQYLERV